MDSDVITLRPTPKDFGNVLFAQAKYYANGAVLKFNKDNVFIKEVLDHLVSYHLTIDLNERQINSTLIFALWVQS